jgi:hypothetical protein
MQFGYTIVHVKTGDVFGTNERQVAESYVQNNDYVVVNNATGQHYDANGNTQETQMEKNTLDVREDPDKGATFDPNDRNPVRQEYELKEDKDETKRRIEESEKARKELNEKEGRKEQPGKP